MRYYCWEEGAVEPPPAPSTLRCIKKEILLDQKYAQNLVLAW
ncbi:MAG: hypothetical protein QXX94_05600 [Candidatus Bathyarchaeia archaeon]